MSALTPHIRVLRAEAADLIKVGREAHASGNAAADAGQHEAAAMEMSAALILTRMAQAKFAAADRLDEQEREIADKLTGAGER